MQINSVSKSYDVSYANNGWSEQFPEDWWDGTKEALKEILDKG